MLTDSPWARLVDVAVGSPLPQRGGRGGGRDGDFGSPPGGERDTGGAPDEGRGGMNRGGGGGGAPEAMATPVVTLTVRFHSALPVKQAAAKTKYGSGVMNSPEASQMMYRQETFYIVGVSGLPAQLVRDEPEALKEKAQLRIKGKPSIYAKEIRQDRSQGRIALYLFFPRENNPIVVGDGEVEVRLELRGVTVKRTFKLKDMVYEGKLEI
jgi:hypothetical protein